MAGIVFKVDLKASKSAVLDYNKSSAEKTTWSIHKQPIPTSAFAQHLGIVRDTKSHVVYSTIEQNIKKGRRAAYRHLRTSKQLLFPTSKL